LARPYFDDSEYAEVKKVLESRWVSNGPTVKEFERLIGEYLGAGHSLAVNSCTSALQLSLLALGVGNGDEVIVPDFTFPATGNAVLLCGATPVVADVDVATYNMDCDSLESKITEKTKAVMPVHLMGNAADMGGIGKIAGERNLPIVEDAACALGTTYAGKLVGSGSEFACYSYHARKSISTGEGGHVATNNPAHFEKMKALRAHGMSLEAWDRRNATSEPSFAFPGYNFRMSDVNAAMGIAQLRKLDAFIGKRRSLAGVYRDAIADGLSSLLAPQSETPNSVNSYQSFGALVLEEGLRDKLVARLKEKGIGSSIGTYSLSNIPYFKAEKLPNGTRLYRNSICLPLYYEMGEEDVKTVISAVKGVASRT
jgi:dTDP-4-amino-4,6-dideoxygalactose transaminase